MKITDVRVLCFRQYLEYPIRSALGEWKHRNAMNIVIETNEGIFGLGETFVNFPQWSHFERKATVLEGVRSLLIGLNPLNISHIHETLERILIRIGTQWGAAGIMYQVLSGVDIALWDIKGKWENVSVHKLLGGTKKTVPVYSTGLDPYTLEEGVRVGKEKNIKWYKLKIGFGIEKDKTALSQLQALVGNDGKIAVDANQAWDLCDARYYFSLLEEAEVLWLEEPLLASDYEGLVQLRKETALPIASGENLYGRDFKRHMDDGLIDFIQPDVTKCGGITSMLRIAELAEQYSLAFCPHFFGNGIGMAATLQIMQACQATIFEYADMHCPLRDDLFTGLAAVENGQIAIPNGSGLGVSLRTDMIEQYRFDPY
jgi:D-galactarolactone cycloisomerase